MNPLLYLLIIPTLTMVGIVFIKDLKSVRVVAAIGMTTQLVFSFVLLFWFYKIRNEGNKVAVVEKGEGFCQFMFHKYLLTDGDNFETGNQRNGGEGSTTIKK